MARQSISFTEPNADWLRAQVESKEYSSHSEVVNDVIRRAREHELQTIRERLIEAEQQVEKKGWSKKDARKIINEAIKVGVR